MPNWCYTTYRIKGDPADIDEFCVKIRNLERSKEPIVRNGFGNLWLGCIVKKLGGDYDKVYCRGEISSYEKLDDGTLSVTTETAWSEMSQWRNFIKEKYPSFKIYFYSEESGCGIYETNDRDGEYFPERYLLDGCDEPRYFNSLEDACKYVSDLTGKQVETEQDITEAIEDFDEEDCMNFYEIEVVDD